MCSESFDGPKRRLRQKITILGPACENVDQGLGSFRYVLLFFILNQNGTFKNPRITASPGSANFIKKSNLSGVMAIERFEVLITFECMLFRGYNLKNQNNIA